MEALWIALGKIGGLAAIGGLIDLGLRKKEKERLKHWMIVLWDRFDSVKWSNFGQEEAKAAIRIIDRVAGRRLLSVRTWLFTLGIAFAAFVLSITWVAYHLFRMRHDTPINWSNLFLDVFGNYYNLTLIAGTVVAFALSISVTRAIASFVARFAKGPVLNALLFSVLLIVHVVLFVVWTRTAVRYIVYVAGSLVMYVAGNDPSLLDFVTGTSPFDDPDWDFFRQLRDSVTFGLEDGLRLGQILTANDAMFQVAFSKLLDCVSNGARIVFALVFLSSFVFRPLVQAPISRLWAGFIDSDRPIFATLFGAIGAIVVLIQTVTR